MNHDTGHEQKDTLRANSGTISFVVTLFFLNMLSRLGLAPLLPDIERDLSISHAEAGAFFLCISLGYSFGTFNSGFISHRLGHKNLIALSSTSIGVILLIFAFSANLWQIRLSLVALGLVGGLYLPSGVALLTALVRKQDWGKVLAIQQLAPNMAYICAPLAAEILMIWLPWKMVLATYGLASILVGLVFLQRRALGDFRGTAPGVHSIGRLLTDRTIWALILLFSLSTGVNQGIFAMTPLYLTTDLGLDSGLVNHLLSLSRVAAFGTPLLSGWISDRHGLKQTLSVVVLASGLGTLFLGFVPARGIWVGLGLVFQAVTVVCIFPLAFDAVSRITAAEDRNVAVSVVVPLAFLIGAGLVPTAIGYAGDHGCFRWAFATMGALTVVWFFFLRRMKMKN